MIKIKIKKNNYIEEIKLIGHAEYGEYGEDIVCASATSIAIVTANAIEKVCGSDIITSYADEGNITITISSYNEISQQLLENMISSLNELEEQYPKNIKIY